MSEAPAAGLGDGLDDPEGLPVVVNDAQGAYAPKTELAGGIQVAAFDSVSRVPLILAAMREQGGWHAHETVEHGLEPLLAVHDESLLDFLEGAWGALGPHRPVGAEQLVGDTFLHERLRRGMGPSPASPSDLGALGNFCFDTYGSVGPGTYRAALGSVDAALSAVDLVRAGAPCAVALTRPPGHHVSRDLFGGGCYLNNAGVAAQALRDGGLEKVAVLDIDFHHGNGTQSLFYDRADVLYGSLHGDPRAHYPYHLGWREESGAGDGAGMNVNVPLPPGPDGDRYRACLAEVTGPVAEFGAGALVLSLGVDTLAGDPSGDCRLTAADLREVGRDIGGLGLPTVALLEGGYELDGLGEAFTGCVRGLAEGIGRR